MMSSKTKYVIELNGLYSNFAWEITKLELELEVKGTYESSMRFKILKEEILANFNTKEEAEVYLKLHGLDYVDYDR
jgi:hypothetical protein